MTSDNSPQPSSDSPQPSVVQDVIDSAFQPGVNRGLLLALNLSFAALLITLGFLAFMTGGNFHAVFLFLISAALFVAMQ
ncbi:hypothetical protein IWQ62_000564 [Dispira parvispora]|uniref:Uncharacterized protein n=1 Tax=Dispira parvispora TaxID=1520584 RepID=A0A9W8AZW8_9FUNG|nr:hypothetical protein IWQ62_000564 [Dispira parvispora]